LSNPESLSLSLFLWRSGCNCGAQWMCREGQRWPPQCRSDKRGDIVRPRPCVPLPPPPVPPHPAPHLSSSIGLSPFFTRENERGPRQSRRDAVPPLFHKAKIGGRGRRSWGKRGDRLLVSRPPPRTLSLRSTGTICSGVPAGSVLCGGRIFVRSTFGATHRSMGREARVRVRAHVLERVTS